MSNSTIGRGPINKSGYCFIVYNRVNIESIVYADTEEKLFIKVKILSLENKIFNFIEYFNSLIGRDPKDISEILENLEYGDDREPPFVNLIRTVEPFFKI